MYVGSHVSLFMVWEVETIASLSIAQVDGQGFNIIPELWDFSLLSEELEVETRLVVSLFSVTRCLYVTTREKVTVNSKINLTSIKLRQGNLPGPTYYFGSKLHQDSQ